MKRWTLTSALATALTLSPGAWSAAPTPTPTADLEQPYVVGVGMSDVTGEPAGVGMFGYGRVQQKTAGIHMRLRARAFLVEDPHSQHVIVMVVSDLGAIMQGVQQEVLRRLHSRFGDRYQADNILLTATHTHSGPAGHSHYTLYNLTTLGHREATFQAIVDGIVQAIERADAHRAPGSIHLAQGELFGASRNRALPAFMANPASDRAAFPQAIDPLMTVLTFKQGPRTIGVLSLFPSHATCMTNTNTLISGDHKGYAAWHWEHDVAGVRYLDQAQSPSFVAAFAQTTPGDMSANLNLRPGSGPTEDEVENTRIVGERQFELARQLSLAPGRALAGPLEHRLRYIDMSRVTVQGAYSGDGQIHHTCSAALGTPFAAGSKEDGPGLSFVDEGIGQNPWLTGLNQVLFPVSHELQRCQAPKDVMIPLGTDAHDTPWTPQVLPVQLLRLGPLVVAALPGEPTIISGLRIRRQLAATLGLESPMQVIVMGYANAYAGYITTPEEYDVQGYEGASTHFGRWTLPAYTQELDRLAQDMKAGRPPSSSLQPPDMRGKAFKAWSGVIPDTPMLGHDFGDVVQQPQPSYRPGQTATVVFCTGYPNNDLHREGTYLEVQGLVKGRWLRIADDGDWHTRYRWERSGLSSSTARIEWRIPPGTPEGAYRIVHHGNAKNWRGQRRAFTGLSQVFQVR